MPVGPLCPTCGGGLYRHGDANRWKCGDCSLSFSARYLQRKTTDEIVEAAEARVPAIDPAETAAALADPTGWLLSWEPTGRPV